MNRSYDVIVIGLGAMGSAAACELARRGHRVLGLDRWRGPHAFGSSHGRTRIIRQAYYEHPLYVPLVRRAYHRWAELKRETGRSLLRITGGLMLGAADGVLVCGARASARTHGLAFEELAGAEIRRRFPALQAPDESAGILEPQAGVLFPEQCIEAFLSLAGARGAELQFDEPALEWRIEGEGVAVSTAGGVYRAGRLILAAGPWTGGLLNRTRLRLSVERQVALWFTPARAPERFGPDRLPVFLWEWAPDRFFYGIPDLGDGFKVARHHEGETTEPDTVRREVGVHEVEQVRDLLGQYLPDAGGALRDTAVCLYTNTPDGHFVLDFHPHHPQVVVASPCSGHGFKFASVIGEILADLAIGGSSGFDLTPFSARRAALQPVIPSGARDLA
ncbi:MAG: N-methyl-L-tryptophan oxidase [Gemmatimonadales bacterium]